MKLHATAGAGPKRKLSERSPKCLQCISEYTYEDGVCPDCAHEWPKAAAEVHVIRDAVGSVLKEGDSVTVVKDLKGKGSSQRTSGWAMTITTSTARSTALARWV